MSNILLKFLSFVVSWSAALLELQILPQLLKWQYIDLYRKISLLVNLLLNILCGSGGSPSLILLQFFITFLLQNVGLEFERSGSVSDETMLLLLWRVGSIIPESWAALETNCQHLSASAALNLNYAFIHSSEILQLYGNTVQNNTINPLRKKKLG